LRLYPHLPRQLFGPEGFLQALFDLKVCTHPEKIVPREGFPTAAKHPEKIAHLPHPAHRNPASALAEQNQFVKLQKIGLDFPSVCGGNKLTDRVFGRVTASLFGN